MIASCQTGVAVQCRTQLPGARCDIVGQMDDSCLWSGAREAPGAREFKIVWWESVRKSYSCSKVQKTNTSGSLTGEYALMLRAELMFVAAQVHGSQQQWPAYTEVILRTRQKSSESHTVESQPQQGVDILQLVFCRCCALFAVNFGRMLECSFLFW